MSYADYEITDKYVFFLSSFLSQWYPCKFVEPHTMIEYNCAEQYMMAGKARVFNDKDTLKCILDSDSPSEQKKLGRKIKGFDEVVWDKYKFDIVCQGNYLKFSQNPQLLHDFLQFNTGVQFVECNPKDNIWGIGLAMDDSARYNPSQWKGENLLGEALSELHEHFFITHANWK